ncbi:GNAT family N-acetyltransferase [Maridesulfovibrio salexigens]|uniref:GCN5-related N-acetyltransferase n=1 Tax=Maridesulfovibrio salexigens (strain ATCC 14822 / DSM 2638 / NCIMB 8403 / VKM B-1763) TaxID=526222 RepID=C6C1C9_MARSD|nr:GNAT family N-acetyltransferase [Maridesulfovibrio salexigens]ACS81104.1 GCN5-related N-acetyltransferase [Maridesulfovibrio salexigens DSM 2638]
MNITLSFELKNIDWIKVAEIFEKAPLGTREPEKLSRAAANSELVCFAKDGNEFIGFARAISDGEFQAAIYDLCILPEYQSHGLGKKMMTAMMEKLGAVNVILYAVPGKEGFYKKFGFTPMLTAMGCFKDEAGMIERGYLEG